MGKMRKNTFKIKFKSKVTEKWNERETVQWNTEDSPATKKKYDPIQFSSSETLLNCSAAKFDLFQYKLENKNSAVVAAR